MALNLSRIFKGKSPAEGVVTDNVEPDEGGAPQPNPQVIEDHIDMIGAPDRGVMMKAGNDNITLENYRSANPGSDGVKWEGPDFDAAKSEVVYNGHAGLGANLEQENGGLDTVDEEPLFDEADALFGKASPLSAQYNPKELGVDNLSPDAPGQGITESIDFPSYVKDGSDQGLFALPEVDDEVLVQFNKDQATPSGIHDIHMNQGNSYTATDDLWKFKSEGEAGAGGNEAARTMGPGQPGEGFMMQDGELYPRGLRDTASEMTFSELKADGATGSAATGYTATDDLWKFKSEGEASAGGNEAARSMGPGQPGEGFMMQDGELYPRGLRDMEIDLGKSGAIIPKVEGNFESDGGSGGFLSQLNPGRPEAQGWYVPELDSDSSAMAVAEDRLGNFEIQRLTGDGRADGYTATDDLWKFVSDKSPTSTGDQPELQATGGDDSGRPLESLSLNLKEAGLGGPDTTERFALDLGGAFAGVKDDESAAGGDNARTAGPGPGENFRPNPTGDGTTQHFSSGQDARIDRQFQAMPELDANGDGAGYIGETEKDIEQKVIRDGKLTDNEFKDDQSTNPGFQSAEGRTMDFELGVADQQEFQAMPELDASGNSFVDAADYTVWRDNLRGSNPPEGILPFIEQNNLVGGERFTASEEQLKTLMANLQEKGLLDTSTGEIVWGAGDGSASPTGISEANQLLDWLRATQPPVVHVEDGPGAPGEGSPTPTGISETNKILDFMPGNQPPDTAGEDGFVAPGDVAGMKFRFEGLPGDTDYVVTPDGGDTARSMGPGAPGFRPNPAGDGTTEHFFKSVGGLSSETEVVAPGGNSGMEEDIADRVADYREGGVNDTTHFAFDDDGPATFLDGLGDSDLGGDEAGTLKVEWLTHLDASQHNQTDIEFAIDDLDTDVDVP